MSRRRAPGWRQLGDYDDAQRFKIWHLATGSKLHEVVLGTVNAVRDWGEPELRHVEPREVTR